MRKKFGINCMIFGALLIVAALSLMIYNYCADRRAADASDNLIPKIKQASVQNKKASDEMKVVMIDGYGYVGYLSIPALGLELPVMSECDYDRLKMAPCRYYGSVKSDDMVIAAHNYTRHFGRLTRLKNGDDIIFTDMEKNVYKYKVGATERLDPTATAEMIENDWDLTLYTCTYGGASRITVRCEKTAK
ncbi:MAG: sortase [Ruminococcus sp.]|nr:sortase [Ruminococcus sp.]